MHMILNLWLYLLIDICNRKVMYTSWGVFKSRKYFFKMSKILISTIGLVPLYHRLRQFKTILTIHNVSFNEAVLGDSPIKWQFDCSKRLWLNKSLGNCGWLLRIQPLFLRLQICTKKSINLQAVVDCLDIHVYFIFIYGL